MDSRPRLALVAGAVALLFAGSAAAQEPSASAKATARALMDEGNDRRDRGDLRGALEDFRAAEALVRVPTTTLEVARTEAALGLLVEAREHIEPLVDATPPATEARELAEARAAAADLSDDLDARIPSLRLTAEVDPRDLVALSIDGEPVPRAARAVPHKLDPGPHVVVARTRTGREARLSVTLREREARAVVVAFPEAPPAAATPPSPTSPPPPPGSRPPPPPDRALAWVSFGVGGAGLLAGVVAGLVALSHRESAAAGCEGGLCPPATFHDLDAASSASTVSNVGFVVAGLGAAVGIADLLATARPHGPSARSAGPWVGAGTIGWRGSF